MKLFNFSRLICVSTLIFGLYSGSVFAGWDDSISGQVTTNDSVGIGTSSIYQSADMELYGNGEDTEFLIHEDAGTNETRLHLRRGTRDWEIINNGDLIFEGETEEKFRITLDEGITVPKRINLGEDNKFRLYRMDDFIRLRSFDKPYTILAIETDPYVQLGDPDYGKEAAISLNRGVEGSGNGRELFTITNLNYGPDSHVMRMSIVKSGIGQLVPFVIRYWNQDTSLSMDAFRLTPKIQTDLERVDAQFTGNVGIGTIASDTYQLAVEGKIGAREVVVTQAGWADYVFEDDYALPSLNHVESFIKENKHLPDIPSAKQVTEEGLSMAEMMSKQMQKIEELTLYVIDQHKKLETVLKENEQLKTRVSELESRR